MPRRCCIPGCSSNYDSIVKIEGTVTTFSIPKNEELKKLWLRAIPRADWTPSLSSVVCIKHFYEDDIIKTYKLVTTSGIVNAPLSHPQLSKDAVPRIFPNLPKHFTKLKPVARKDPEVRRQLANDHHCKKVEEFLKSDVIQSFSDFICNLPSKVNCQKWDFKVENNRCYFYVLNLVENKSVSVLNSIIIYNDLTLEVYIKENKLSRKDLLWVLPNFPKLSLWSQFENLLSRYAQCDDQTNVLTTDEYVSLASDNINLAQRLTVDCDDTRAVNLLIINEQLKLLQNGRKRYVPSVIVFAFLIYHHSPAAYDVLRKFLVLPHKRRLQHISSSLRVSPDKNENSGHYLLERSKSLSEREKFVSLIIDEIYVNSHVDYKAQHMTDFSENGESVAKTVVCFMIASNFGSFREVVQLVAVKSMSGSELMDYSMEVLNFVEKLEFHVTSIITDNNKVNQNFFSLFKSGNASLSRKHPIFLFYDTVHLLKNIRNNWINLKSLDKMFIFPDFDTFENKVAKFKDLCDMHYKEKNCVLKQAYKLNQKTLGRVRL